jgi:hypothetical protein
MVQGTKIQIQGINPWVNRLRMPPKGIMRNMAIRSSRAAVTRKDSLTQIPLDINFLSQIMCGAKVTKNQIVLQEKTTFGNER